METCYGMDSREIESLVETRLFVPVLAGPLNHLALCTMGAVSPGVKWLGIGADIPTPSTTEFSNGMEI
jgi:hypothetical protein